ncbi:uncharacterized protein LOC116768015 isoform X1 [Danaus plexippus]|uniref:uncharacterized protein LOC116768015 isoform X1 n=1 Tax=Danaus plexippus TaxID=13037 RepID=UPI0013C4D580|nr:uncharacterized protein LOC116768015 isoform X1 [Danaus plexippus]
MCVCALLLLLAVLPSLAGPVGPSFSHRQQRSVVGRVGDVAELKCRVNRLADRVVSWVRSSDLQILTHAGAVFTADSRVSCSEAPYNSEFEDVDDPSGDLSLYRGGILTSRDDSWDTVGSVHTLKIERLRVSDSGRYECQINTEPKLSLFFNLTVVETSLPSVVVRTLNTDAGDVVWVVGEGEGRGARLTCEARYEPAAGSLLHDEVLAALPPLRITWKHEGETIDPQSPRGGISLDSERWSGRVVSRLTLARVTGPDAGRYWCGVGDAGAVTQLRLKHDQGLEPDVGELEWMQRDQAVARVSGAGCIRDSSLVPAVARTLCSLIMMMMMKLLT